MLRLVYQALVTSSQAVALSEAAINIHKLAEQPQTRFTYSAARGTKHT